ncbi:MAG: Asp-tRNA(Asn)/Glu-tRNA(Gln) amidotransferase subunit GatC [Thermovirgaceae bacterium]|nr:Asp-tRNA(Asn)/Glu-tRNA(Gln) amidotransferase subunit GatC [Thermovirgaceae bacterium]
MAIDEKDVLHVARLARLDIAPDRIEPMVRYFQDIIGHFRTLEKCDTDGIDPFEESGSHLCPLRDDEPKAWDSVLEALEEAPLREGRFFKVPAIGGGGDPDALS